jgi:hypothetical protein
MVTNQLMAGDCRMLCEEHCSDEIRCLVSHPWVMAGRRLAVGFLQIVPGVFPTGVVTPMKHAAAKVGGNQGRMAGRRRAVGFLQIVPAKRWGVHSYETRCLISPPYVWFTTIQKTLIFAF